MLDKFVADLADLSKVDQQPLMEGRRMTIMLTPEKKKGAAVRPADSDPDDDA